jgi:hypothetical protein
MKQNAAPDLDERKLATLAPVPKCPATHRNQLSQELFVNEAVVVRGVVLQILRQWCAHTGMIALRRWSASARM